MLGAFLAGMVLRRWAGSGLPALEGKLDALGYGFFIPIFFVYSGMTMDLRSMVSAPLRVLMFAALMLLVHVVPAQLLYRRYSTRASGGSWRSSPRRRCRCSSRSPRSACATARCCPRTPPRWWEPAC